MGAEFSEAWSWCAPADRSRVDMLEKEVVDLRGELEVVKQATRALASPYTTPKPTKTSSMKDLRTPTGELVGTPKLIELDMRLKSGQLSVDEYAQLVCREDSLLRAGGGSARSTRSGDSANASFRSQSSSSKSPARQSGVLKSVSPVKAPAVLSNLDDGEVEI